MDNITKKQFLDNIKQNCDEVLSISTKHILDKLYKNDDDILKNPKEFFANYKNYHLYLNDFAGTIYNRYSSSVDSLYIQMCDYLKIDIDNAYTLEHTISKLEKQTPQLLLSLSDYDIQKQTIEHFEHKLKAIDSSTHYQDNKNQFKTRVDELKNNITLVKKVVGKY
jgi:hypothetical protein